jgi:myo-inositol-1(or 4)-monophosphatase
VSQFNSKKYPIYANFLNQLAKDLTTFYYSKLNKTFKVSNKLKGKGIDPIDGTRSFVIGNPTWSNLISLNYKGKPIVGLANFPVLKKYYLNFSDKVSYVFENGKRKKLSVNKKAKFNNVKVSAAFHGWLSLEKQKKIPQILKLMQFPCSDALSYSHLADGRVDIVIQCSNKIWDIHPVIPIIKAAGGIISTWDNQDAVKAGNILVSANIDIHKKFLRLLKPVSK